MEIKVTLEHICHGQHHKGDACPVALALREAFPNKKVWVDPLYTIEIGEDVYVAPEEVRQFVERFDDGEEVEPFAFNLPKAL